MQRDCYRCGRPLDDALVFCSACGAPQVRVAGASEHPPAGREGLPPGSPSAQNTAFSVSSRGLAPGSRIDGARIEWKYFFRTAVPLAGLVGMLTLPLPPLGLFVLLPASSIWAVSRYLRHCAAPLRGGQGARMGALMGLLSFVFFLAIFLLAVSVDQAKYRQDMINMIQERAAQTSDLQAQQTLQWFATPDGLVAFFAILLVTFFVIFLIIGMSSGALAVNLGKARNRPQV